MYQNTGIHHECDRQSSRLLISVLGQTKSGANLSSFCPKILYRPHPCYRVKPFAGVSPYSKSCTHHLRYSALGRFMLQIFPVTTLRSSEIKEEMRKEKKRENGGDVIGGHC